jgi:hypothetical protein
MVVILALLRLCLWILLELDLVLMDKVLLIMERTQMMFNLPQDKRGADADADAVANTK